MRRKGRTCVFLCQSNNSFDVGVTLEHSNSFLRGGNDCQRFLRGREGNRLGAVEVQRDAAERGTESGRRGNEEARRRWEGEEGVRSHWMLLLFWRFEEAIGQIRDDVFIYLFVVCVCVYQTYLQVYDKMYSFFNGDRKLLCWRGNSFAFYFYYNKNYIS